METQSKIAIIGAGPVGLSAAAALKRKNISYDQYEATSRVGGNWSHGVYRKAHIISSKRTTEFSDYPMPASYPDFPSADQMLSYLDDYCEHFALKANILFEKKVENIAPTGDGNWLLKIENGDALVYNGVIICNGHHWDKRWPKYEGEFSGEFIHSKDYQDSSQLAGKRVLIIGGGNSACDIACDAARVAKKLHLVCAEDIGFYLRHFTESPQPRCWIRGCQFGFSASIFNFY